MATWSAGWISWDMHGMICKMRMKKSPMWKKCRCALQPRSQTLYSNFCIRELNLRIGDLLLSLPGAFRVGVCGGHSSDRWAQTQTDMRTSGDFRMASLHHTATNTFLYATLLCIFSSWHSVKIPHSTEGSVVKVSETCKWGHVVSAPVAWTIAIQISLSASLWKVTHRDSKVNQQR